MHPEGKNTDFLPFVCDGVVGAKECCIPAHYHLNAAVPVLFVLIQADTGIACMKSIQLILERKLYKVMFILLSMLPSIITLPVHFLVFNFTWKCY